MTTPDWDKDRVELLRLAHRRECRLFAWTPTIPCDWVPQTVWDPRYDMYFSDQSAWLFIIELLESGRVFTRVPMKTPPNTIGYEIIESLASNLPQLYIKIQAYKGKILGRSFHNVTK